MTTIPASPVNNSSQTLLRRGTRPRVLGVRATDRSVMAAAALLTAFASSNRQLELLLRLFFPTGALG